MKLSIVIPCFNEIRTIEKILANIKKFYTNEKEIIIVDDCSTDGTKEVLQNLKDTSEIKLIFLKTGFKEASGEIIITQDADLEYHPRDYENLLAPFKETDADVVYGSRFLGSRYSRLHYFSHYIANKCLTFI